MKETATGTGKTKQDDPSFAKDESMHYCEPYRELAGMLGETAVRRIWRRYAGVSITFPRQLYSRAYIREFIEGNRGRLKPSEMARAVGLSERRVRQILQEARAAGQTEEKEGGPDRNGEKEGGKT